VTTLIEFLSVEGQAETQSEAWIDFGVVGEGEDTAIVDLTLEFSFIISTRTKLFVQYDVGCQRNRWIRMKSEVP